MEKKALGIGVVGAGSTGIQSVCQHTCEEDKGDLVWTAAVMDPVPGRAQYVAEKFNVPHFYTSYEELLADPTVDLVTLASPIGVHFAQGMQAIHAGKHVHFNKTMTISTAEATALIEEAKKYNVKIVSSPGQMTSPANRRVRKAVLTGELGIPTWTIGGSEGVLLWHCWQPNRNLEEGMPPIDPSWYFKKPAGGPVWDCTVYALHTMTGIFGPAKRVTCMCGQRMKEFAYNGGVIHSEVDDSNQMILDFGDGFFGIAYSSLKRDFGGGLAVFGTEGEYRNGELNGVPLYDKNDRIAAARGRQGLPHLTDHQMFLGESHIYEDINQLADWVLNGIEPYCTCEHARHVIEIIEAAYQSAEEGRVVELKTSFEPLPLEKLG